ncbi:uncharacterized protein LOC111695393 [Eurytemora carolleeae]|uniref:uncharacterized protein LOC111695393 n=1 Tax=Eurytemora carolleeae TaxID=1294199 RepID=UPI000C79347E|nr:uncharacterized protein LOC111695393 [Eurytemora carolleeae]|eukprot:XP_023320480.1 uncharacterized protein LOC111695393 [Eurytemora affinis]
MTFLTEEEAKHKPKSQVGDGVESVHFQDLMDAVLTDTVVVKIDIEGHECKALIPYLQTKIKSKFVPYILMEWIIVKDNRDGMCPDVQLLIQGFIDSGYHPADLVSMKKLNVLQQKSWNNVLWIHKDAKL